MGKCPFWSTNGESVECFADCIMNNETTSGEVCYFKECLEENENLDSDLDLVKIEDVIKEVALDVDLEL